MGNVLVTQDRLASALTGFEKLNEEELKDRLKFIMNYATNNPNERKRILDALIHIDTESMSRSKRELIRGATGQIQKENVASDLSIIPVHTYAKSYGRVFSTTKSEDQKYLGRFDIGWTFFGVLTSDAQSSPDAVVAAFANAYNSSLSGDSSYSSYVSQVINYIDWNNPSLQNYIAPGYTADMIKQALRNPANFVNLFNGTYITGVLGEELSQILTQTQTFTVTSIYKVSELSLTLASRDAIQAIIDAKKFGSRVPFMLYSVSVMNRRTKEELSHMIVTADEVNGVTTQLEKLQKKNDALIFKVGLANPWGIAELATDTYFAYRLFKPKTLLPRLPLATSQLIFKGIEGSVLARSQSNPFISMNMAIVPLKKSVFSINLSPTVEFKKEFGKTKPEFVFFTDYVIGGGKLLRGFEAYLTTKFGRNELNTSKAQLEKMNVGASFDFKEAGLKAPVTLQLEISPSIFKTDMSSTMRLAAIVDIPSLSITPWKSRRKEGD